MVGELHRRGYQRLRVMPHIYELGTWRLALSSDDCFLPTGLVLREDGWARAPQYSSADENRPFGWTDAQQDDARALAEKFIARFADLCGRATGRDWAYAGWFVELMGWVEAGYLPFSNPNDETGMLIPPELLRATPLFTIDSTRWVATSPCPLPPPVASS